MTKVTLTFEDVGDKVDVQLSSDLPVPQDHSEFSPAQIMAISAIATLVQEHDVVEGLDFNKK